MTIFIIVLAITVMLALIVGYATRREPLRNGYQARQRTHIKGAGVVIIEPKDDPNIVGGVSKRHTALVREMHKRVEM